MEIGILFLLFSGLLGAVAYPSYTSRRSSAAASLVSESIPFENNFAKPIHLKSSLALSGMEAFVKRSIDIAGAVLGLILTIPVFMVIPLLIKLTSKGPIFYVQRRVGHNRRRGSYDRTDLDSEKSIQLLGRRSKESAGKIFKLIKFRTMVCDAEKKCGPVWAVKNDPRITVIGKILRKTRIDEIPQLINVLKGDMSLVGPRPERPFFVNDFVNKIPGYEIRYLMKPGITGLSQIHNGYDDSLDSVRRKVSYDISYIKNWNILCDFKIIMKTIGVIFTTKGAL